MKLSKSIILGLLAVGIAAQAKDPYQYSELSVGPLRDASSQYKSGSNDEAKLAQFAIDMNINENDPASKDFLNKYERELRKGRNPLLSLQNNTPQEYVFEAEVANFISENKDTEAFEELSDLAKSSLSALFSALSAEISDANKNLVNVRTKRRTDKSLGLDTQENATQEAAAIVQVRSIETIKNNLQTAWKNYLDAKNPGLSSYVWGNDSSRQANLTLKIKALKIAWAEAFSILKPEVKASSPSIQAQLPIQKKSQSGSQTAGNSQQTSGGRPQVQTGGASPSPASPSGGVVATPTPATPTPSSPSGGVVATPTPASPTPSVPAPSQPANGTKFTCPTSVNDKSELYRIMQANTIWSTSPTTAGNPANAIVFLDNAHPGKAVPSFVSAATSRIANYGLKGVFKINYNYKAKECRRAIEITDDLGNNTFAGWMIVELCDPAVRNSVLSKTNNSPDIAANFVKGELARLDKDFGTKNRTNVIGVHTGLTGGESQFFKVRIKSFKFVQSTSCNMVIDIHEDVENFAGIGQGYDWGLTAKNTQTQVYYFDSSSATQVLSPVTNPLGL